MVMLTAAMLRGGEYRLGEGWQPDERYPVYLGGYFSVYGGGESGLESVAVDEFAVMAYGEFEKWGFMSELEMLTPYTRFFGDRDSEEVHTHLYVERLYGTWYIDDTDEATFGQFFSEIGFWNTYAINVLRATTSDPHFIETMFPQMSTGVLLRHHGEEGSWNLTLQHNNAIDDIYNFRSDRHYAVSWFYDTWPGEWRLGAGWFRTRDDEKGSGYATAGYRYQKGAWCWLAEGAVRKKEGRGGAMYDLYVQGVRKLTAHQEVIVRTERYEDESAVPKDTSLLVGYAYRPYRFMAFKAEAIFHDHRDTRWLVSYSMMF